MSEQLAFRATCLCSAGWQCFAKHNTAADQRYARLSSSRANIFDSIPNSVSEIDRHPLHFCPICLRKLLWNLDLEPSDYLHDLGEFCLTAKLDDEANWYAKAVSSLKK